MVRSSRLLAVAALLLTTPALAQIQGASDGDAFIAAIKNGESGKAVDLLEKPGSTVANYRAADGNGAIHLAMRNREGSWVGYLLSHGAEPDLADKNGDTALILAARMGYSEGAARMIMGRAQIDKTNKMGETALIVAVQQRQPAIVKMLLEAGANPDKEDHASGLSAREYAKRDTRAREMLALIETVKSTKAKAVGPVRP
jgi:ankyrin repeat protein